MKAEGLNAMFDYHPPTEETRHIHEMLRKHTKHLAKTYMAAIPNSRERTVAIRKLWEALTYANAAVARHVSAPKNRQAEWEQELSEIEAAIRWNQFVATAVYNYKQTGRFTIPKDVDYTEIVEFVQEVLKKVYNNG